MRKGLLLFAAIPLLGIGAFSTNPVVNKADGEPFNITVLDQNNLATWKYDWNIVEIGSAKCDFDTGHLRMENINMATANYALYQTNKFNEFRMDMHANLNIKSPSDLGIEGNDWCDLYFTYFIDFEDATQVENCAQAACPWSMNKGWMSVAFERIAGQSHIQLYVNETFDNDGTKRFFLNDPSLGKGCCVSSIDFVDNQYHWFTIEVTSTKPKNPSRIRYNEIGTNVRVLIDGVEQTNYFLPDEYYSNTRTKIENIPFHEQKGYAGFWAMSSYGAGYNTSNTGVAVDIDKLQFTSYDGVEDKSTALPYERCPKAAFHLDPVLTFSPEASYEVGEEMELPLSELFTYDGDNKLTYTATCKGNSIGTIRNGYFVWTPDEAGTFDILFEVSDGDISAENEIRFRTAEPYTPNPKTPEKDEEPATNGCGGSIIASSVIATLCALGSIIAITKKKKDD